MAKAAAQGAVIAGLVSVAAVVALQSSMRLQAHLWGHMSDGWAKVIPLVDALLASSWVAAALALRLTQHVWPTLALSATGVMLSDGVGPHGFMEFAAISTAGLLWFALAGGMVALLRRTSGALRGKLDPLQMPLGIGAGLAAGVAVLLLPGYRAFGLHWMPDAWWQDPGQVSDLIVAHHYALGGLALGSVTRWCWQGHPFPRRALLLPTALWCALAARTLLDAQGRGLTWQASVPDDPVALAYLLPIAAACLAGSWLAGVVSQWKRHA